MIALNRIKGIKGVLRDLFNFFIRPFLESFAKPPDKGYHQNERIIRPRPVFTTSLERRYRCDNVKTHYHYINPCHHWNSIKPTGCEITTSWAINNKVSHGETITQNFIRTLQQIKLSFERSKAIFESFSSITCKLISYRKDNFHFISFFSGTTNICRIKTMYYLELRLSLK